MNQEIPPRTKQKTPYEILGISSSATEEEVRAARKRLLIGEGSHPDQGGTHDRMAEINTAVDTLLDPEKRRELDDSLAVTEGLDEHIEAILDETAFTPTRTRAVRRTAPKPETRVPEPMFIEVRRTYTVGIQDGKEYLLDRDSQEKLSNEGYTQIEDRGRFLVGKNSGRQSTEFVLDPKTGERLFGPFSKIARKDDGTVVGTTGRGKETILTVPLWEK